ncbi:MAG: glycosyltransferase family 4 protein [Patescibacteria group bacterium]
MRILIVTDSYPPEVRSAAQLMSELAEGLCECGNEITVATTMPGYNLASGTKIDAIPREETINGVRVIRITTLPHHNVPYILRGINQLFLPNFFTRAVLKILSGPFDAVIVHSPPLPLALAAAKLAKHYSAKFIPNIHDIFPQNGIDLVTWWQKPLIQFFFGPMEKKVYKLGDLIIVPSEAHADYLEKNRNVPREKLNVIPHWIDTAPFDAVVPNNRFRKMWRFEGKFVFLFAGVIGPSQGLEMVFDVAEEFQKEKKDDAVFLFVGDGTDRARLQNIAREKNIQNVMFKSFVSSEEYPELVKEMDVAIVTLTSKNTTPAVPAKLVGYMAAGVPVVVAVHKESDALRIVNDAKCGFTAVSSDSEAVTAAFRAAYDAKLSLKTLGENGRRYTQEHFAKEKLIAEWDKII